MIYGRRNKSRWWVKPLPFLGVLAGIIYCERYTGFLTDSVKLTPLMKYVVRLFKRFSSG